MNEYYQETLAVIDGIQIESGRRKRRCAIFVMVQNEKVFLPIWLKYYTKYFSGDDIYVFDHRTDDGSVEKCSALFKFRNIRLEYPFSFDHLWFRFVASSMQKKLLKYYEYVIFTDVDEILMPHPAYYSGLDDYIEKLKKKYVRCIGYELIHLNNNENSFDSRKTVLSQRSFWYRNNLYNKTLLSSKSLSWRIGFHGVLKFISNYDNTFLLIHLHKIDYDYCWNKSLERSKLQWTDEEIKKDRGWQNRITDKEKFDKYYYTWPEDIKIVEIPEEIRKMNVF